MTKVLTNSQGKIYVNQDGKALASESGDVVVAINTTGNAISNGDKVWIEKSGNNYDLINYDGSDNYSVVGTSVQIVNEVASNFQSSSYLQLPQVFNPANNTWEIGLKFKTGNNVTTFQGIFHSFPTFGTDAGRFGIVVLIGGGVIEFDGSYDGSSWGFIQPTSFNPQPNTDYWIKCGWTGTEYYLDYSTDGTNYTRNITYSSSTPVYSSNNYTDLGVYSNNNPLPWLGSLYLSDCYIKINGSDWWIGKGVDENSLTGYAQENIASGSTGNVKTVLGD